MRPRREELHSAPLPIREEADAGARVFAAASTEVPAAAIFGCGAPSGLVALDL